MSHEALSESLNVFSEGGSQHIGVVTGCSHELCPVLGTEQETLHCAAKSYSSLACCRSL